MDGDGVINRKKKEKTKICKLGCGKGSPLDDVKKIYLCSVPIEECERDGVNALSYTKHGSIMG